MKILKTLVKKQMLELNKFYFMDAKTGKRRSKGSTIGVISVFVVLFAIIGFMFFEVGAMLVKPLYQSGLTWLYFVIMMGVSILMGVFGSVFNTYASLYKVKDNDLLLAMPIPTRYILFARLLGVYLMGLLYSALVFVPTLIAYFVYCYPSFANVVLSIWLAVLVTIFVFSLSAILGYFVAKISSKLKNKSIVTVIVSLVFFAIYYVFYFYAGEMIGSMVANGEVVAGNIKAYAYPIYALGKMVDGDWLSILLTTGIILAIFAVVCIVLSKSFLKIVTSNRGEKLSKTKDKVIRKKSVSASLLGREFKHFFSSAAYMLNCGFGTFFLLAGIVFVAIKFESFGFYAEQMNLIVNNISPLMVLAAVMMLSSMNDLTAPSISIEGKNLWIVQSLPVSMWQVIKAKIGMHLILTLPLSLVVGAMMSIAFKIGVLEMILVLVSIAAFVVLQAGYGMLLNLKFPNLKWQSESIAVKQGISVFLAIFGVWGYIAVLAVMFYFLINVVSSTIFIAIVLALNVVLSVWIYHYLKTKGAKILERLE